MKTTAIFLYEPEQIASLDALIADWNDEGEYRIVSLDARVDAALKECGRIFQSSKNLRSTAVVDREIQAEK